jgi:hypothetical protein
MRPRIAWGEEPPAAWIVLKPSMIAAATMQTAPSTTFAVFLAPAPRSSENSSRAHSRPINEFVFQSGKAVARPTSRMAKTVSVLATAHSAPARIAHTIRCFLAIRSAKT